MVCFLSVYFLEKMKLKVHQQQKYFTAGGLEGPYKNHSLFVSFNQNPKSDPCLQCNAEESDTRIWLHTWQQKLILSPDTDVYHIGLPVIAQTNLNVIVQLSSFSSIELRLLDLQALISAFNNDPHLASVPSTLIPKVFQTVYVSTGCDFVSFFTGIGKATFLNTLYEYCDFICSDGISFTGKEGFLLFIRLVGCAYYKKHKFPTYPTPMSLFHSTEKPGITSNQQHSLWLQKEFGVK